MKRPRLLTSRETAVWVVVCLLLGAFLTGEAVGTGDQTSLTCGIALLLSGVGLGFRERWAKYTAILAGAVFCLMVVSRRVFDPNSVLLILAVVSGIVLLWTYDASGGRQSRENEPTEDEDDEQMTSLVALLPEPPYLDASILARLASTAWGVEVGTDEDDHDEPYVVVGESPHYFIRAEDRFIVVHNVSQPYFDDQTEFADQISESRVRQAVLDHHTWLSVDVVNEESPPLDNAENYRMIGRLLAELIDDNCLAVCCPETGSIHPYQPSFAAKLRSDDPLDALHRNQSPPVMTIDENNPQMRVAVETARKRWPEFVLAFENRGSDDSFSVKAPLCDSTGCEQIWLRVTAIENDVIYGILENEPVRLKRYKYEDRARTSCGEVTDWLYFDDGEIRGGFTIDVLSRAASERERRKPPGK